MWHTLKNVETQELIRKLYNYKFSNNLDGGPLVKEGLLPYISFKKNIYKNKSLPTLFVIGFVEFGCELFFPLYVLPNLIKENPNFKIVFVGWKGRDYFYKHLVDEYWELDEKFMELRSCARAMNNESCNLKKVEDYLSKIGVVLKSDAVGNNLIEYMCLKCHYKSGSVKNIKGCPVCGYSEIRQSLLSQRNLMRDSLYPLPEIRKEISDWAKEIVSKKSVAIFARKRDAYGRNLSSEFYIKLINMLKLRGYNPIWIGERQSSLKCPCANVYDFSQTKESEDLEKTIALISYCEFTMQFWTASTRLSMLANTKFFLVECPEQIYGNGQEGIRLSIFNRFKTKSKLFLCNYNTFVRNFDITLENIDNSLNEFLIDENYDDSIKMIENKNFIEGLKKKNAVR